MKYGPKSYTILAVILVILTAGCISGPGNVSPNRTATTTPSDNVETSSSNRNVSPSKTAAISPDDGEASSPNQSDTSNIGAPEGPPNSIGISVLKSVNPVINETGFYYNGRIVAELNRVNKNFHNVIVCLYDEQWNVITSKELGTFRSGNQNVSLFIHTREIPERMIVEHPDFREQSVFGGVLIHQDGQYVFEHRSNLNRAPPTQPGNCR